jgi:hypothetical protein
MQSVLPFIRRKDGRIAGTRLLPPFVFSCRSDKDFALHTRQYFGPTAKKRNRVPMNVNVSPYLSCHCINSTPSIP